MERGDETLDAADAENLPVLYSTLSRAVATKATGE
jgi:hypothetical protein